MVIIFFYEMKSETKNKFYLQVKLGLQSFLPLDLKVFFCFLLYNAEKELTVRQIVGL